MAPKDKTPTPNAEVTEAFSRVPTYFGKVDLIVTALGLLGDKGLGKDLLAILDAEEVVAPGTDVQAVRDAQQAALDSEAAQKRTGKSSFKMPEDPRDAEIAPNEQAHEDADKLHGESTNDGMTDGMESVPYTGAPEPEDAKTDIVIEAPADSKVKKG